MSIETQRERVKYLQRAIQCAEAERAKLDPRFTDHHSHRDISDRILRMAYELKRLGGHLPR
jgi:hypothetical protein